MVYKTLSIILVALAILIFFIMFSGGISKGFATIRGIVSDKHASVFLLFSMAVAASIIIGAGVVQDGLTIKNILLIP